MRIWNELVTLRSLCIARFVLCNAHLQFYFRAGRRTGPKCFTRRKGNRRILRAICERRWVEESTRLEEIGIATRREHEKEKEKLTQSRRLSLEILPTPFASCLSISEPLWPVIIVVKRRAHCQPYIIVRVHDDVDSHSRAFIARKMEIDDTLLHQPRSVFNKPMPVLHFNSFYIFFNARHSPRRAVSHGETKSTVVFLCEFVFWWIRLKKNRTAFE